MSKNNINSKNKFNIRTNKLIKEFFNRPTVQPIHFVVDSQTYNLLKQEYNNNKSLIFS